MNKREKIKSLNKTIGILETKLKRYKKELRVNPASLFYKGLEKNTSEFMAELEKEKGTLIKGKGE